MKRGRLITVGSFDGVHRGHQTLLDRTVLEARKRHLKSLAISFSLPPRMILDESARRQILSSETEKAALLASGGMDEVEIIRFDRKFSEIKPFSFFRDVLINGHGAKGIVVGADFRFGAGRSAGAVELVRWGLDFGIPVWVISPVKFRRKVVSSTLIRGLMDSGRFKPAVEYLGHPYLIAGKVVRGRGIGRKLGFATANLQTGPEKMLPSGVFAVRVCLGGSGKKAKTEYAGVANIGVRPTFGENSTRVAEVHLFGHPGNLRGKVLFVRLLKRLRGEKKFASVNQLKTQIARDIRDAQRVLGVKTAR